MTRLRGTWAATAAVALFLISACARTADGASAGSAAPPSSSGSSTADPDSLVLRVEQNGGFVPAEVLSGRIPSVSIYADGRVITLGPQIAIYPGPALPNLQVQRIPLATVDALVAKGVAAGVKTGADLGHPGVTDIPTTRITVVTAAGPQVVDVDALNEARPDDPNLTAAQHAARAKLAAFVRQLSEPPAAADLPEPQAYQAKTVAALARPYVKGSGDLPKPPAAVAWPGPALPGDYLSEGTKLGCVSATGAEATKLTDAAAKANAATPWTSGGKQWGVTFRPMLPDETDCADLKAAR
jgi:hypothetical protein